MQEWIQFFVALLATTVQWLTQMQIVGVPVFWILISGFILGVLIRALLFKP
jgi:hypothetical protein